MLDEPILGSRTSNEAQYAKAYTKCAAVPSIHCVALASHRGVRCRLSRSISKMSMSNDSENNMTKSTDDNRSEGTPLPRPTIRLHTALSMALPSDLPDEPTLRDKLRELCVNAHP